MTDTNKQGVREQLARRLAEVAYECDPDIWDGLVEIQQHRAILVAQEVLRLLSEQRARMAGIALRYGHNVCSCGLDVAAAIESSPLLEQLGDE